MSLAPIAGFLMQLRIRSVVPTGLWPQTHRRLLVIEEHLSQAGMMVLIQFVTMNT